MSDSPDFTDRFEAPSSLGEGASGEVFKATDPRSGRTVAVKVLHSEAMGDPRHCLRFQREIQANAVLEHPNIPPLYESGKTEAGRPFMAMRLIEGERLDAVIARLFQGDAETHTLFPFSRRLAIAIDLCDAVDYAHQRGLVHRDIKPENIMLGGHGEVWLVDWGLAAPPSQERNPEEIKITEDFSFVGTLSTAAPEQLGGVTTPASDQYSLGVVFYELFALRSPYPGETRFEVMQALLSGTPKAPEHHVSPVQGRVPREISVVIARMLSRQPEERFPSIAEVKKELAIIADGDIRAICPHTLMKKTGHRLGRMLDTHNLWLTPLVLLWLCYPIIHWISLLVGRLTK